MNHAGPVQRSEYSDSESTLLDCQNSIGQMNDPSLSCIPNSPITTRRKFTIVTISDNVSPVNMPYNEFTLYRQRHFPGERQFFIVLCENYVSSDVPFPDGIIIYRCGTSIPKLRKALREIFEYCEQEKRNIVFHLNEGKAVVLFNIATLGKYRKQIVYTIHSTFSRYAFHNKIFASLASIQSRRVICVSQTSYRYYPLLLKKLLGNRVTAIQNGVDYERIDRALADFPTDLPDSFQGLRLVYIARLIPLKRHDILLQALRELPDVILTLIGKGKQKESLQTLAKEYGISKRVNFEDVVPRDEVYTQIKEHDVYVSSSSYEGLPISLLEAMSCGVVCVVSNIEQHREIQEKCPSLITVNNTPEEWVKAISRIASMKTEERAQIAAQNKRDVDRYFSLERMHAQYDRVYEEIIERIHV